MEPDPSIGPQQNGTVQRVGNSVLHQIRQRLVEETSPLSTKVPKPLLSESPRELINPKFPIPNRSSAPVVLRGGGHKFTFSINSAGSSNASHLQTTSKNHTDLGGKRWPKVTVNAYWKHPLFGSTSRVYIHIHTHWLTPPSSLLSEESSVSVLITLIQKLRLTEITYSSRPPNKIQIELWTRFVYA